MLSERIDFESGVWTNVPVRAVRVESGYLVEAQAYSDAWRYTSYGFLHDTEHGLLRPLSRDSSVEVTFRCELTEQFDQAGILIRHDGSHWIKAGVEFVDGYAQVGAVVTHEFSDWSVAPVDDWLGKEVTIRASWSGDAVTIRAKAEGEDFRLVVWLTGLRIFTLKQDQCCAHPLEADFLPISQHGSRDHLMAVCTPNRNGEG